MHWSTSLLRTNDTGYDYKWYLWVTSTIVSQNFQINTFVLKFNCSVNSFCYCRTDDIELEYSINAAVRVSYGCGCSYVLIASIPCVIILHRHCYIMVAFSYRLIVCLFLKHTHTHTHTHTCSRKSDVYAGVRDSLCVAANVDDFDCLRTALGLLRR